MSHVQGPWQEEHGSINTPELGIAELLACDRDERGNWYYGPISKANAKLIAAAPEMLDELEWIASNANEPEIFTRAREMIKQVKGK